MFYTPSPIMPRTCTSCNNTYIAAKKRHVKCIERLKDVWHPKTLCGAIMSGDRRMYDTVKAMDANRTSSWQVVNAAAKEGWCDVVADYHRSTYTRWDAQELMYSALLGGHLKMCEFVYTNYFIKLVPFNEFVYRNVLMHGAIKSGSLAILHWFVENFEWRPQYVDGYARDIMTCAIMANDVEVLEYLWPLFDIQMHAGAMQHWYLNDAFSRYPNSFKFLVDKCTNEIGYEIEASYKNYVILSPRHAYENIVALYNNNNEWTESFRYELETELRIAGPRQRIKLQQVKQFAAQHGMYDADKWGILRQIRAIIGDVQEARDPVDIGVLMTYIDNTDMPEGKYVEVCKLMRKLYEAM